MEILRDTVNLLAIDNEDINELVKAHTSGECLWIRDVNADKLLPRVAFLIAESIVRDDAKIRWYAECQFILCMCDQSFMLGSEGYALTTIMQSLKIITNI